MKILIIIPAYNEEKNIENVINDLSTISNKFDYVIVNDGSKDNTADICYRNGYNIIDLPINLGLTGAVQAGMKYAYLNKYDGAVQFDGDGQHDAKFLEKLANIMEKTDFDIVIGSRFVSRRKPNSLRMLGSNIIQLLIKITTGKRVTDPTSGMRLFNKKIISEFAKNSNYAPEPDTLAYLIRKSAKFTEIQVDMDERLDGESYLSPLKSIEYMINTAVSILFIQWFRKER